MHRALALVDDHKEEMQTGAYKAIAEGLQALHCEAEAKVRKLYDVEWVTVVADNQHGWPRVQSRRQRALLRCLDFLAQSSDLAELAALRKLDDVSHHLTWLPYGLISEHLVKDVLEKNQRHFEYDGEAEGDSVLIVLRLTSYDAVADAPKRPRTG